MNYSITDPQLKPAEVEKRVKSFLRTRLSTNFIMQDFMKGVTFQQGEVNGYPTSNHLHIIESGKVLAGVCEAIEAAFGRLTVTYGYKTNEIACKQFPNGRDSDPHAWDKGTKFKGQIFARMDVMVFAAEDGRVTKHDIAKWLIQNTMVDLVMTFPSSNVLCITVAPMARRVYKEWTYRGNGTNGSNQITHIGENYWQCEYGTVADWLSPVGAPSCSGGHMNWYNKFNAVGY